MDQRLQVIFSRRSVRKYTDQPVSEADITSLLEAGMAAPSAMNKRPWHLVAVTDKQVIQTIAQFPPYDRTLSGAALVIVVCGDPAVSSWWLQDCTLATQNILIAATGLELGAVFLGCHGKAEREDPIRQALGIPDEIGMASVLCIGHPAEEKEPRTQYDPAQAHRNRWTS
jgi:nitroreductase